MACCADDVCDDAIGGTECAGGTGGPDGAALGAAVGAAVGIVVGAGIDDRDGGCAIGGVALLNVDVLNCWFDD